MNADIRGDRWPLVALAVGAVVVVAVWWLVDRSDVPLGVTGEWTWGRYPPDRRATWLAYGLAGVWGMALAAWAAWGLGWIEHARRSSWCAALAGTTLLVGMFQFEVEHISTPGLYKWTAALYFESVGGPYSAVRDQAVTSDSLLRDYPGFLARFPIQQGHVSNQPPGLFLAYRALLDFYQARPGATNAAIAWRPAGMKAAMDDEARLRGSPIPRADQAVLVTVALASRLLAILVVLPVAALARLRGSRTTAWLAAAAAGLAPAMIVFAPRADTAFPTWTAVVLLLTAVAIHRDSFAAAVAAGLALALGAFTSLVFAAVAFWIVVWIALHACLAGPNSRWQWTLRTMAGGLAGFAMLPIVCYAVWGINLPAVWTMNLRNHAAFYDFFPRSYWPWVGVNLLELAVALGPPAAMLLLLRLMGELRHAARKLPCDTLTLSWWAVVLALNFSGRNLSEIARLWLFLMPLGAALGAEALTGLSTLPRRRMATAALVLLQVAACLVLARTVNALFLVDSG